MLLKVKDNGIGLPSNFKVEENNSLGLRLVYSLTNQIDGQIEVNGHNGANFSIKFHERKPGSNK